MQFLVIARDGEDASERRLDLRDKHLAVANHLRASGNLLYAVATLDGNGQPNGSMECRVACRPRPAAEAGALRHRAGLGEGRRDALPDWPDVRDALDRPSHSPIVNREWRCVSDGQAPIVAHTDTHRNHIW